MLYIIMHNIIISYGVYNVLLRLYAWVRVRNWPNLRKPDDLVGPGTIRVFSGFTVHENQNRTTLTCNEINREKAL